MRPVALRCVLLALVLAVLSALSPIREAQAAARIKDIARLRGVRGNQLVGYGLVVGLNGTGDKRQTLFTIQSLTNMLERMGVSVNPASMRVGNVAAVMVTATLPPFARAGETLDITASSIGDSSSLQGGVLLLTPLKALDGQIYAIAQGPLVLGGFSAGGGQGNRTGSNHPTVGRVPSGATVEREVPFTLQGSDQLTYTLQSDDFTTAAAVATAINTALGSELAQAQDSRTVNVSVPENYRKRTVEFISRIEVLPVSTDMAARVILNEKTGTVVLGGQVRLGAVTTMHGNLSVEVSTILVPSQPAPLSEGKTVVVPETTLKTGEEKSRNVVLGEGATVDDLVRALSAIGATPRDVVAIIQAIHAAGALRASLEVI